MLTCGLLICIREREVALPESRFGTANAAKTLFKTQGFHVRAVLHANRPSCPMMA